jgi:hypothetical protein
MWRFSGSNTDKIVHLHHLWQPGVAKNSLPCSVVLRNGVAATHIPKMVSEGRCLGMENNIPQKMPVSVKAQVLRNGEGNNSKCTEIAVDRVMHGDTFLTMFTALP